MTLEDALCFMRLTPPLSLQELDLTYRQLIKKYHPDRNQERLQWSHEMTLRLNEAYALLRQNLIAEKTSAPVEKEPEPVFTPPHLRDLARKGWQKIEDGMHLYYVYGLENPHLRQEGPFHIKYILALKQIQQGRMILDHIGMAQLSPVDNVELQLEKKFTEAFLQSARIQQTFVPDGTINHKAYKHYFNGSRLLDAYLKKSFFPADFTRVMVPPKCVSLCEQELLTVLLHYSQSAWVEPATIKLSLLDSMVKLLSHRAKEYP